MDSGTPPTLPRQSAAAGRIPLAVIVVDGDGLVSHWSTGARRLFGPAREEAVGRSALDLLPVSGALREDRPGDVLRELDAYDAFGPGLDASLNGLTSYPTAGRATLSDPGSLASMCSGGRIRWSGRVLSGSSCWRRTRGSCTPSTRGRAAAPWSG